MGIRITTWNVNGIRNPFGYQPWREQRSFAAMFDILEADIVIFQETKIQRKDLDDGMVLVPGWDCFFSLPKHKKGYSGVVVYTRQSVCAPIRAEEGITGLLCPPNSSADFSELPEEQQIGGYPTSAQLSASPIDAVTLDSEGRCVIVEFPAFVLLGVYCPANRDETRDDFRLGFLDLLDARIRNLIAIGKRVFLAGDLNISREELDTANPESALRKHGLTAEEYASTPGRRLFNQMLEGGKVFGGKDEGREKPVMWDICRAFHLGRKGMFTCWEQKTNARPANCGARIDYVLCSLAMKEWFLESNIQEGLMGSDHCPVYAIINDKVSIDGVEVDVCDVMNPPKMFIEGKRQRDHARKDLLPLSGKLIPEFDGRRNIGDMFARKPSVPLLQSAIVLKSGLDDAPSAKKRLGTVTKDSTPTASAALSPSSEGATTPASPLPSPNRKRSSTDVAPSNTPKRMKPGVASKPRSTAVKGQQSLRGFFTSKATPSPNTGGSVSEQQTTPLRSEDDTPHHILVPVLNLVEGSPTTNLGSQTCVATSSTQGVVCAPSIKYQMDGFESSEASPLTGGASTFTENTVHDPIESKESWTKLFTKPAAPRCEGHNEPCISLLTKKSGMNNGRSFWMCPRPIGPTGAKEKNTQWRCQTFIWCSDWNPNSLEPAPIGHAYKS